MGKSRSAAARQQSRTEDDGDAQAAASASSAAAATDDAAVSPLERVSESMSALISSPALFFAADAQHAAQCMRSAKELYDLAKSTAPAFLQIADSVPTLLTHARTPQTNGIAAAASKGKKGASAAAAAVGTPFSSEQIFAQLALHTNPLLKRMDVQMRVLKAHVAQQEKERLQRQQAAAADQDAAGDEEQAGEEEDEDEDAEDEDGEDAEEDGEDAEEDDEEGAMDDGDDDDAEPSSASRSSRSQSSAASSSFKGRGGVEEDAFFSLEDMEKFADQFEDEQDDGDIDLGGEDDEEQGEDDEEEENEDDEDEPDDALDIDALKRKAIRAKHDATLKPLGRPLREELKEIDLEEDVGEVDLKHGERYEDFFDPPPEELVKQGRGKKGKQTKAKSMEEHYAEEDANEDTYLDDDHADEFGGAFKTLAKARRRGMLGDSAPGAGEGEGEEDEEGAEAALAASAPLDGSSETKESTSEANLSSYERASRKLAAQVAALEAKIVRPREWAQMGEVSGKNRPVDALLTTNLEFEHAGKVAPVITQAYTEEIEAMIKRRVVQEQFNDPVRKTEESVSIGADGKRKVDNKRGASDAEPVSDQKSSIGLGEVYEQEALATVAKAEGRLSASEEKVSAAHKEIGELMGALFHKLDSLCNFHFTPRSIHAEELSVRTHAAPANVSSLSLEEAMPGHMSTAAAQAPQEAYTISAQAMVGDSERASSEKDTIRRRHKAQRKRKADALAAKEAVHIASLGKGAQGNAAEGILRTAISSKEMHAATTARNVIQAGGKTAPGGAAGSKKKGAVTGHGQNTKFGSSGAFFGKMQTVAANSAANKKQRTK